MVSAEEIKKLREETGAGVMDAKKALEEVDGDFDKAVKIIKEKGLAKAEKRSEREAKAGLIKSYVHNDRVGTILKLNCETDFVAKSDPFLDLAHELTLQIVSMNPESVEELLEQDYVKDTSQKVKDLVTEAIRKTGENIVVDTFYRLEL
ncbi:MAG: translation elongation factor Ts [Candidatus Colwellbacteria bacterium CG10_big_fil_rev_8_21_14_0_10_41_28]|uniref:Elongation factor Ts n=1 Tax=Candidatus Colwellbacteria bacterium CG10_big_fil_rev_8_21_14_0_10_41_28 TaxID=1974539 RepID=A0A2H0VHC2_9BACT|nr:MAG: translation elongation factor Ts [Candidatus Colwellbacteria bacterium CG10_big_fil_rev_8_21_14_0_10_41_28]